MSRLQNHNNNLRYALSRIDGGSVSIQNAAGEMMRLYATQAAWAVTEWRNAIQSASESQLLPLLYVANEVIQTSKRNRGNNFLIHFSPVLLGALQFMCQAQPDLTEKVRRTCKIWGVSVVLCCFLMNKTYVAPAVGGSGLLHCSLACFLHVHAQYGS
jgi:hypothetical protein